MQQAAVAQEAINRLAEDNFRRQQERARRQADAAPPPSHIEAERIWAEMVGPHPGLGDWKEPNYEPIRQHRAAALSKIRANPGCLPALKLFYKLHPADFIDDWGYTFDPRNVEIGLPAKVPFILFPKQREWIEFVIRKWHAREPGLTEKSRDCGLSWLAVGLGCTLCLFYSGVNIGFGSRKAEYVDKKGFPKALFWKARKFMEYLPPEFNGGWDPANDAPEMRMLFHATESTMTGEGGDNIGRGDRASIYFVDEAAYLEQPALVEASLSQTTNCQQDISSVHGNANPFAIKRHSGKVEVFVFDWMDDPRKDQAWYDKQVAELDAVVVAQEIDRNYSASVAGIVIPSTWVRAAIDAHLKLCVEPSGSKEAGLDVADEGPDKNAMCGAYGILVEHIEEWSGKGGDIYDTVEKAFGFCDDWGYSKIRYDADGLGAGVRGDARKINEGRRVKPIDTIPFRGSGKVYLPENEDEKLKIKNKDRFKNLKAQGWWTVRERFRQTYMAVVEGKDYDADDIISLSGNMKLLQRLVTELSQPTYEETGNGKIQIDKKPNGAPSPNLADSLMIRFARIQKPLPVTAEVVAAVRAHRYTPRSTPREPGVSRWRR